MTAEFSRDRYIPTEWDEGSYDDALWDYDSVVPIVGNLGGAAAATDESPPEAKAVGRQPPPPGVAR